MVLRRDQRRQAEHVRQQDEFLTLVIGDVAHARQEADGGLPFGFAQADLAGEGMQMLDQTCEDGPQPLVAATAE